MPPAALPSPGVPSNSDGEQRRSGSSARWAHSLGEDVPLHHRTMWPLLITTARAGVRVAITVDYLPQKTR